MACKSADACHYTYLTKWTLVKLVKGLQLASKALSQASAPAYMTPHAARLPNTRAIDSPAAESPSGVLQEAMLQLWVHESLRVFGDRIWDGEDLHLLRNAINERLTADFSTSHEELFAGGAACPPFASFLHAGSGTAYQPMTDMRALKVTAR